MNFARLAFMMAVAGMAACTTLQPAERTARIPNIPVEEKDCESPIGLIKDGESKRGFLNESEPVGKSCQLGKLICHDGQWSGDYVYKECRSADSPGEKAIEVSP